MTVPLTRIAQHPLCPYTALRHAFRLVQAPLSGPAFIIPASTEGGLTALTFGKFDSLLKLLVARTNIDPSQVSGHSFRSGGATLAFQAQIPAELIKRLGHWESGAYRSYIHIPVKDRMHAVQRLASCVWIFPAWRIFRLGLGGAFLGQMLLNGRVHIGALPSLPPDLTVIVLFL